MSSKPFSCLFKLNVFCSYVKSQNFVGVMDRCLKCRHYEDFLLEMAEEDEKIMDEIDEMRRYTPHG